jgi:hypothetical protein
MQMVHLVALVAVVVETPILPGAQEPLGKVLLEEMAPQYRQVAVVAEVAQVLLV